MAASTDFEWIQSSQDLASGQQSYSDTVENKITDERVAASNIVLRYNAGGNYSRMGTMTQVFDRWDRGFYSMCDLQCQNELGMDDSHACDGWPRPF